MQTLLWLSDTPNNFCSSAGEPNGLWKSDCIGNQRQDEKQEKVEWEF